MRTWSRAAPSTVRHLQRTSLALWLGFLALVTLWAALAALLAGCAAAPDSIPLLAPPTPLTGEVSGTVSGDRAPLNLATVSLSPSGVASLTDAAGAYTLGSVAPGTYLLRVSATGFRDASRDVTVLAGRRSGGDVRLVPLAGSGALAGRITDGQHAVSGARVVLTTSTLSALTGDDGTFLFSSIAPGLYDVQASRNGFETGHAFVRVVTGELARTDLVMARIASGTLTGRLTDGVRPIASCSRLGAVLLFVGGRSTQVTVPRPEDCARSRGLLTVDDRFRFENLSTGPHILQAVVNGFQTGTKVVEVLGGMDNNGDLVLSLDGTKAAVTGTVLDPSLLPVSAAQVVLSVGTTTATTSSGTDGRFVLSGLTPGTATLTVSTTRSGSGVRTLTLSAAGTADGTILLQR
ncbi:MAG: carboxypeptidase regulatory-like domain-containing protein [Candidatus Riflebacteria bacterium]|nr:carboxypeptidase regulatory-like domain-containing protein [Candidatus Riflebacteria bacterium]